MPRSARLDAPGVLHHVMTRGIERRRIFRDDLDREDFVACLSAHCRKGDVAVFAWSLMTNHAHILLRTSGDGLSHVMQCLLGGYVGRFNRRHRRHGHLFQNRFKSIVVESDPYLLELVLYIHLNTVRAGIVENPSALAHFPWSGHARLLGTIDDGWQDTESVLSMFAKRVGPARRAYLAFVDDGANHGRRPDLQGGGLRRSRRGCEVVASLPLGRESWAFDERVLGSSEFVAALQDHEIEKRSLRVPALSETTIPELLQDIAARCGVPVAELCSGSKRPEVVAARTAAVVMGIREHSLRSADLALALGVTRRAVVRLAGRGKQPRVVPVRRPT